MRALRCSLLLVLVASGRAFAASGGGGTSADRIHAAAQQYEALEYEKALESLKQAHALAQSPAEHEQASLYEGIIYSEMGRVEDARAAFDAALGIESGATLPVMVSPKVSSLLEEERTKVKARAAAPADSSPAAVASTDDASVRSSEVHPNRVPGLAVAGAGAAFAIAGTAFLIDANAAAQQLSTGTFSSEDGLALRDRGSRSQMLGAVGLGVGVAAIAAGAGMLALAGGGSDEGAVHAAAFAAPGQAGLVVSGVLP